MTPDSRQPLAATPGRSLAAWQKLAIVALVAFFVGLGFFLAWRTGRQKHKQTDLGVYLRAAWAVHHGADPYAITDENGWHYHYPPTLAVLLGPLSDPPPPPPPSLPPYLPPYLPPPLPPLTSSASLNPAAPLSPPAVSSGRPWPWTISVALWYGLSLGCLVASVHLIVRALAQTGPLIVRRWLTDPDQPRWYLWLWYLAPITLALPALARNLARGQVGTLVLLGLCGFAADLMRGKRFRAGLWLSAAICIKIIPAYLLLIPLWRRDARCLLGSATGLIVGLILIPMLFLGPDRTVESYRSMFSDFLAPAVAADGQQVARSSEITHVNATDSNSPLTVLHNLTHLSTPRDQRPTQAARWTKIAHWSIAGLLTLATLAGYGISRRKNPALDEPMRLLLLAGALTLVHLMVTPVSHPHYYSMAVLPVLALLAWAWPRAGFPDLPWRWNLFFWSFPLAHLLTTIPGLTLLRDGGLVLLSGLAIWGMSVTALIRSEPAALDTAHQENERR